MSHAIGTRVEGVEQVLVEAYRTGKADSLEGPKEINPTGLREAQGVCMTRIAQIIGAERTIETGFCFGLSGLHLLRGLLMNQEAGLVEAPVHFAMDPFQSGYWKSSGLKMFEKAQVTDLLRFEELGSEIVLPNLLQAGEQFDLAFIDGDHKFDSAFIDLFYMTRLVRPGGVLLIDDIWMPAVRGVVNFAVTNLGLTVDRTLTRACAGQLDPAQAANPALDATPLPNLGMAVLRVPENPEKRNWEHFVPFGFDHMKA